MTNNKLIHVNNNGRLVCCYSNKILVFTCIIIIVVVGFIVAVFFQSVCPHGFFGHNCANKCKDTCNGCNHVNGLCDNGCLAGWNGEMCRASMFTNNLYYYFDF